MRVPTVLVAALLATAPVASQDLDEGTAALRTGDYGRAEGLLERASSRGPVADRVAAVRALTAVHMATGEYEDALEALDRAAGSVPPAELATARGRVLRTLGREEEALSAFDRAIAAGASDVLLARLERATLLWNRGGRTAAYRAFETFIDAYNEGAATSAGELTAVGTAVRYLGRRDPSLFHDAVRAYEEAIRADPSAHEPRIRMAELFLEKYDGGEAQALLGEVLAVNERHPEALLMLARAKRFEGSSESVELTERALETNPASPDARAFLGLLLLELGEDDEAVAEAERALEVDPRHRSAMAVRAAARYLSGDRAGFQAERDRVLRLDAAHARFFVTVAELAVRRGRYHEAVALAGEAIAVDSTAWDALALLGMNRLRIGDVEGARASLERAFEGDPFNVWTDNTLKLLDRLDGFETVRTDRYELVLHPSEAALLAPYIEPLAEEAFDALADRYGFAPETPVRVEFFPDHGDFSVRTMGLTGLAALGVAFGNVLAVLTPAARDPGAFHWGSTLWHEIAHAVTLGLTEHRIPRWLTEGISVREERRSRPGWGGRIGLAFLQAFHQELLLPLTGLDAGFVRPTYPGQVGISYQHASLIVEKIERDHGTGAVRGLMQAYSEGLDTRAAFRRVLGIEPDDFDDALYDEIRERHAAGLAAVASLEVDGGAAAHPGAAAGVGPGGAGEPDALARRARLERSDFAAQLAAGYALHRAGRGEEAEPFLERAAELYPEYVGPVSPYRLLASIRRERGDLRGAAEALRTLTSLDESALDGNLALASLLEETGDPAGAAEALERAIWIYPYDAVPHERLAALAVELDRPDLEVRERRALVALAPVDRAGALYRLAVAQRRAGDADGARRTVMQALEVAPSYAEAQDLFLELSGGDE